MNISLHALEQNCDPYLAKQEHIKQHPPMLLKICDYFYTGVSNTQHAKTFCKRVAKSAQHAGPNNVVICLRRDVAIVWPGFELTWKFETIWGRITFSTVKVDGSNYTPTVLKTKVYNLEALVRLQTEKQRSALATFLFTMVRQKSHLPRNTLVCGITTKIKKRLTRWSETGVFSPTWFTKICRIFRMRRNLALA